MIALDFAIGAVELEFEPFSLTLASVKDKLQRLAERSHEAARNLPPIEDIVRGSVFTRRLRCGKATCHCADGEPHSVTYLAVSFAGGRTEQISLPSEVVPLARRWVANYRRWWKAMETISALNRDRLRGQRVSRPKRKRAGRARARS